jgi:hypothetical protein
VADTTNPLPSLLEPVIDRYRRWSPVWWRWIKPLLETVRSTATDIERVKVTVDNLNGKWGVSVSSEGRVTGAVLLDGSQALSTFSVLANKFRIAHPTSTGTEIEAFTAYVDGGTGQPTIGINGNLIISGTVGGAKIQDGAVTASKIQAGSVTADKMNVASLSAISANIGTVTAGVIQNPGGTLVFDLANMRLYRTDGKMDINLSSGYISITT